MNYQEEVSSIGKQINELQLKRTGALLALWENDTLPECQRRFGKHYKVESENYNLKYNSYYKILGMKPNTKSFWVDKFRSIPSSSTSAVSVRFDVELLNVSTLLEKVSAFKEISAQEYDDARRQIIDSLQDKSSNTIIDEVNKKQEPCLDDKNDNDPICENSGF